MEELNAVAHNHVGQSKIARCNAERLGRGKPACRQASNSPIPEMAKSGSAGSSIAQLPNEYSTDQGRKANST